MGCCIFQFPTSIHDAPDEVPNATEAEAGAVSPPATTARWAQGLISMEGAYGDKAKPYSHFHSHTSGPP